MENKSLLAQIIEIILSLISKNEQPVSQQADNAASDTDTASLKSAETYTVENIDWSNPKAKIAKYFTVQDALILREWNRLANESDGLNDTVKKNLVNIFAKMDVIREFLGVPVFIKSAYRPSAYNVAIGGATYSAHMADKDYGAVDFWCDEDGDGDKDGDDCDLIKAKLRPKLAEWDVRMEDNGKGARWVHVDSKQVPAGGNREFKP